MDLEEIDVFIEKDGQVRIEVRGVKGSHCLTVTKDLERALGGQVTKREMTPEASEPTPQPAQDQQGQRRA
ncbi:MAG: DUF2997 domain-containing protein [Verrucomicrobia bacterium]|nr:DUF2997 domain-containing protein [Verrucomicrobiota bacterium]